VSGVDGTKTNDTSVCVNEKPRRGTEDSMIYNIDSHIFFVTVLCRMRARKSTKGQEKEAFFLD
jgi:hypothetical protein